MRSGRSIVLAMVRTTSWASLWVGQSKRLYITSCFWVHRRSSCQGNGERCRVSYRDRARAQSETCHHCFSCMRFSGPIGRAARKSVGTCRLPPDNRLRWRKEPNLPSCPVLAPKTSQSTTMWPLSQSSCGQLLTSSTSSTVVSWEDPWVRNRFASSSAAWLAVAFWPVIFCIGGKQVWWTLRA